METIKPDLLKIKTIAPMAWKDFEDFYQTNYPLYASDNKSTPESLPFEMLLGLLLRYFIENGVEWDITNTDFNLLPETLYDVFENYEKIISHYS